MTRKKQINNGIWVQAGAMGSILGLIMACTVASYPPAANAAKPRSPVTLTVTGTEQVAGEYRIVATATSATAADVLRIVITPPARGDLVSGVLQWQGAIAAGESRSLEVVLRLPAHGGRVLTRAQILDNGEARFGAAAVFVPPNEAAQKATQTPAPQGRRTTSQGRPIIEFPLD